MIDDESGPIYLEITRTTTMTGTVDTVTLDADTMEKIVRQARIGNKGAVRIIIDDLQDDPADEIVLRVPDASLSMLSEAGFDFIIEIGGLKISLPQASVGQIAAQSDDLFFRVVPVRNDARRAEAERRMRNSAEMQSVARGQEVQTIGQPMIVEANYSGEKSLLMLPLEGVLLPEPPGERERYLSGIMVFVEHGDGEIAVKHGIIHYDERGEPVGIEVEVEKFSMFMTVHLSAGSPSHSRYISGYPGRLFRPDGPVTRAELATMIAYNVTPPAESAANMWRFPDLSETHGAFETILPFLDSGWMTGYPDGSFRPDQPVTRAEFALIAMQMKGLEARSGNSFKDTAGHWASGAIEALKGAGILSGYPNGLFKPDRILSRAEAVVMLNRLLGIAPLEADVPTWADVPATHWAFGSIEAAAIKQD